MLAILDCFPDKQKAVPLRAVCKAWRDLFNASVHCITIHSNLQLLPQYPSRFPNLRHLCISQTNSTAAKAAVRLLGVPNCKALTMLEISNTWMQEPPPDLHKLTSLKTLSITSCRMKALTVAKLHLLPKLEVLDLSSNLLSGAQPLTTSSKGLLYHGYGRLWDACPACMCALSLLTGKIMSQETAGFWRELAESAVAARKGVEAGVHF